NMKHSRDLLALTLLIGLHPTLAGADSRPQRQPALCRPGKPVAPQPPRHRLPPCAACHLLLHPPSHTHGSAERQQSRGVSRSRPGPATATARCGLLQRSSGSRGLRRIAPQCRQAFV
uniref:Secreted protein n=1 Tax=Apteryx owenii TaxID=8824 RepID=A0A8B9Q674_APTOW